MTWVVALGSHQPYHISAAWVFPDESEQQARDFAKWASGQIDPCVVTRARDPLAEMLAWHESNREEVADTWPE